MPEKFCEDAKTPLKINFSGPVPRNKSFRLYCLQLPIITARRIQSIDPILWVATQDSVLKYEHLKTLKSFGDYWEFSKFCHKMWIKKTEG